MIRPAISHWLELIFLNFFLGFGYTGPQLDDFHLFWAIPANLLLCFTQPQFPNCFTISSTCIAYCTYISTRSTFQIQILCPNS
jgi:hypothetical protein